MDGSCHGGEEDTRAVEEKGNVWRDEENMYRTISFKPKLIVQIVFLARLTFRGCNT
jgi:hypothetical protein